MTRTILAFLPLALWAAAVLAVGALDDVPVPTLPRHADKVGHFAMYGVGGILAAWAGRVRGRAAGWGSLAFVAMVGAVDEWHQSTLPTRHGNVWDWVADVGGALFFYLITALILRRR